MISFQTLKVNETLKLFKSKNYIFFKYVLKL